MSNVLLDTHALLWFFWDDPQLSPNAKAVIENPDERKLVSIASCWEIAIKVGLGKINLGISAREFLNQEIRKNHFEWLAISFDHATAVQDLPMHHRDPFDRLLLAQSWLENIPIISGDQIFDRYAVARIW